MRIAVLLLLCSLVRAEPAKLPQPFQSIADLAAAAPPEFAAGALLRIAESGKLTDRNARRGLIQRAFELAASAKLQVQMKGLPGTDIDTASGSLSQAYRLKFDALSLQSRAIVDLLPLDPGKARELFSQIVKPSLSPLSCDEPLTYEPSGYFMAVAAIANGAFTPKEKAKEEHVTLLLDAIAQATSLSQIAPLTAAIKSVSLTGRQREVLDIQLKNLAEGLQKTQTCEGAAAPRLDRYWQSANAKQLLEAGKALRGFSATQFEEQLPEYLRLISQWTPDQETSDADYYHEKCQVYISLLDLVSPGEQTAKLLADFVDFAGNSSLYRQSPAEWFTEPHELFERSLNDPARHAQLLDVYQRSGNPALMLEVAMEKLADKSPS